jgi:hypothetical protein
MTDTFGSGLSFGGAGDGGGTDALPPPDAAAGPVSVGGAPLQGAAPNMQAAPPDTEPTRPEASFGASLRSILPGPHYTPPDPQASALDQTADTLQQRIQRANKIASDPVLQFFNPEGVQAARQFVPAATEQLQKIKSQKADMQANRQQAATLGLDPGEVPDEASQADRVEVARAKALTGDLKVFKGLQAVDPKAAEAIQDQVHEVVAGHLTKAQLAFDSLSGMQNQGQYSAKLQQLRKDGTLTDLEALGLKVPPSFDQFNTAKSREGQALREARIGIDTARQKLEERNTYQPMEEKEAKTYNGRLTTAAGDQITNGQWARNGALGTRGLVINGMSDPRDLGKNFTLATPDQRKAIQEDAKVAVSKEDMEKFRANNRTYELATTDDKGNKLPDGRINTNPNVQQGIAEGLASMLRGGQGGANIGLLKIETSKRGYVQGLLDSIKTNYAGAVNTLSENEVRPYLTNLTQKQQRDVLDVLHAYNSKDVGDRIGSLATRAGALGLDRTVFGLGSKESSGVVDDAIEAGRTAQIARMMPNHQAIGGGDGVLQLGAQRPGAGATALPPGTTPTNQLPGGDRVATPVQQAVAPGSTPPPGVGPTGPVPPVTPGGGAPPAVPSATPGSGQPGPAGGGAPVTVAGQQVNVALPPGASPNYVASLQRIESGNEKAPWTAGTKNSSASGAFQFINSTWAADKPPGAPSRAADATPAQQAEALATHTAKNAAALTAAKIPVNDTNLYIAHNLGAGGASKLLQADPGADARTVVGEAAAKNNPLFFRGKPTVATALARYNAEMNGSLDDSGPKPLPGSGGATAEAPGLMTRISRMLSQGIPGDGAAKDKAAADVGNAAVEHAPAIASTLGAAGGSLAGPAGTIAGGSAGGGAGQALKDYLQGNDQSPTAIAKQAALGGVLGVGGAARPLLSAAARTGGAAAVEGGAKALEGGDAGEVADAALQGAGAAAGGEAFGRALGMAGHKVFNMFAPDAKTAVRAAAKSYSEAEATLASESPKLPGVGGAAGGPNPKYEAAQAAKEKAEATLKDAGLKPDEAAYAHKVSAEGVPKQEAEVARPGAIEQKEVGAGYDQLRNEVGAAGVGNVKPTAKLPDGPRAAVENKTVSAKHAELADHVEMAITAPAANWQEKWKQLTDARSQLLTAERDALSSTATGRTKEAADMRALADTVRTQQAKAAKYVFGEKDGQEFMQRLAVLDTRYRRLMDATNNGDLAKAATMTGEAGREAEKKFVAFAHDDPQAVAAYRAMRGAKGDLAEATVPWTVAGEGLPVVGKVIKVVKLAGILREWARERTAGSAVKFSDLVKTDPGTAGVNQSVRDVAASAAQRGAVMQ